MASFMQGQTQSESFMQGASCDLSDLSHNRQAMLHLLMSCHAHAQVEALTVGLVFGIFTSRAVILHSILCKEMSDGKELQHRTWVLAMTLAIWQWVPGSKSSTGQASGAHDPDDELWTQVPEQNSHAAVTLLRWGHVCVSLRDSSQTQAVQEPACKVRARQTGF